MLIKEFRVIMPLSVDEYQVGQLYAVAEASKNETGGGDGVQVVKNEPCEATADHGAGQFTHKIYHLSSKVPGWVRMFAPKGSLEIHETAWNCYPYCKTVLTNPDYMKDNFEICIETWHKPGCADLDNVHGLSAKELADREVINIDIANDPFNEKGAPDNEDPAKFHSEKTGRGPLVGPDWHKSCEPVMTCYKQVKVEFKWWGVQTRMEKYIQKVERQIFQKFHRQLFCWIDKWHGLTMADIRELEAKTKEDLAKNLHEGEVRGTKPIQD